MRDKVRDWIMENYFEIYKQQNQSLRLCEEFLVENIERETIVRMSKFIAGEIGSSGYMAKEIFEQETMKLRNGVYHFMQENWKEMNQEEIQNDLSKKFLMNMISFSFEIPNFKEQRYQNQEKEEEARNKKREEPIQKDNAANEEKPELKKTKK